MMNGDARCTACLGLVGDWATAFERLDRAWTFDHADQRGDIVLLRSENALLRHQLRAAGVVPFDEAISVGV